MGRSCSVMLTGRAGAVNHIRLTRYHRPGNQETNVTTNNPLRTAARHAYAAATYDQRHRGRLRQRAAFHRRQENTKQCSTYRLAVLSTASVAPVFRLKSSQPAAICNRSIKQLASAALHTNTQRPLWRLNPNVMEQVAKDTQ